MSTDIQSVPYKVKKGDTLWGIVKKAGFPPKDWKKILKAKYNIDFVKKLKKEKRTADEIFPGDIIFLPKFNKKSIKKQYDSVVKSITNIQRTAKTLAAYEKAIVKIGDDKSMKNHRKWDKIRELQEKYEKAEKDIETGTGPGASDSLREKRVQLLSKIARKYLDGVFSMKAEVARLKREIELTNSEFRVATMRLNGIVKKLKSDVFVATIELKKSEAELAQMLKNPY